MESEHFLSGRGYAIPRQQQISPGRAGRDRTDVAHLRIAIVGLGYVGLPTALGFAAAGAHVVGYDVDRSRLADINAGKVDLLEADQQRLAAVVDTDQLTLVASPDSIVSSDAVVICVPTPVDRNQIPDLTALRHACEQVVDHAARGQSIILTSTTYVGCTRELLVDRLQARGLQAGVDVHVAFSPERIDPGNAVHVPERTPRVVGGATPQCAAAAGSILATVAADTYDVSSLEVAELAKLLENSFRAVNIALANEFADVARRFSVDPMEVVQAAATKPYGFMPFYPGAGAGGHCIPCDPHYLLWQLRALRHDSPVTQSAMNAIAGRPRVVVRRARDVLADMGVAVAAARILVVGVSYKPNVADLRGSPALEIIEDLMQLGATVEFTDPLIEEITIGPESVKRHTHVSSVAWDLAIIHTVHDEPEPEHSYATLARAVLDTTYRAALRRNDGPAEYYRL